MRLYRPVIVVSLFYGVFLWVFDAIIDASIFYEGSLLSLLIFDVPAHELYIRALMFVVVVGFGVTASWLIGNLKSREQDLKLFRSLIDEANDSVFVIDPDTGQILDANQQAAESLGYEYSELLSKNVTDVSTFVDTATEFQEFVQSPDGAPLYKEEVKHQRADGSQFPVEVSAKTVEIDGDRYRLAIARDITERKERERHLQTLIGNLPGIAYRSRYEEGWPMELVQGRSEELVGHTPEEIEEGVVSWGEDIIHPDDREMVQENVSRRVEQGQPFEVTYRILTKSGEEKWVWEKGRAVNPFGQESRKLEGFITDITDRKRLEQRLSVANRILRHDMRSAVNVIRGNADLAASAQGDPSKQLETIRSEAERLHDLSENARIIEEAVGGELSETEPIDVVPMLEAKLHRLNNTHPDVQISRDIPDSAMVKASHRLDEAIQNVLDNAVVHNDSPEPSVSVDVSKGDEWVKIDIKDNGPGIPDAEIQPIVEGEETALNHTSGLGLWVVKWIVEGSEGHLIFSRNNPRGSIVRLQLPTLTDQ